MDWRSQRSCKNENLTRRLEEGSYKNRMSIFENGVLEIEISKVVQAFVCLFLFWWSQNYDPGNERLECNRVQSKRSLEERRQESRLWRSPG